MDKPIVSDREATHEIEVLIFGWLLLFSWLCSIICMTRDFFMDQQDEMEDKLIVTRI